MGTMKGESSQKNIKIDSDVRDKLEEWVDTDEAKSKGYNSMARVATLAISEFMDKHKKKRFEHFNFADNLIRLIDNDKPKGTPFIEVMIKGGELICRVCEARVCIHIKEAWNHPEIIKQLKRKNIKKPLDIDLV